MCVWAWEAVIYGDILWRFRSLSEARSIPGLAWRLLGFNEEVVEERARSGVDGELERLTPCAPQFTVVQGSSPLLILRAAA